MERNMYLSEEEQDLFFENKSEIDSRLEAIFLSIKIGNLALAATLIADLSILTFRMGQEYGD